MSVQIELNREAVGVFCRKWKVTELSLFGSAIRDDFRSDSDVDVLVAFEADAAWDLFDLQEMTDELRTIMGRDVDLVEKRALRNPFRRHQILQNHEVIYARED